MLAPVQALVVLLGGGGLVGDFKGPGDAWVGRAEFGAPGARQHAQGAGHGAFGHHLYPDPISPAQEQQSRHSPVGAGAQGEFAEGVAQFAAQVVGEAAGGQGREGC